MQATDDERILSRHEQAGGCPLCMEGACDASLDLVLWAIGSAYAALLGTCM